MICELTGMEVSNASMYDGASALAEATVMACEQTRRKEFVISEAVHPEYRETVKTYTEAQELVGKPVAFRDGVTAVEDVKAALGPQTAAVVVNIPTSSAILKTCELWPNWPTAKSPAGGGRSRSRFLGYPGIAGACGADIVVGDGQSFGNPISFGGPHIGFCHQGESMCAGCPDGSWVSPLTTGGEALS